MSDFAGMKVEDLLARSLGILAENHRQIANNLANINTPRFTPTRVDFQESLERASARLESQRDQPGGGSLNLADVQYFKPNLGIRNDLNRVDVDFELTELAKNTGRFTLYSALLNKHFSQIKSMLRLTR